METFGILYGVGVGPGSPDLLTLRAVDVLRGVEVILAPASPRNEHSLALSIAAPHLPENTAVERLDFPMTRDKEVLKAAWKVNAEKTAAILRSGRNAAFLTLGDPMIYSTFSYLMRTLERLHPDLPVKVVPGITSYQEAAAKTRTVLCEGGEDLLLLAGINDQAHLERALSMADSAVILKAYRNFSAIRGALAASGRDKGAVFASRLGLEGEVTRQGLDAVPDTPHYLSLILAAPQR